MHNTTSLTDVCRYHGTPHHRHVGSRPAMLEAPAPTALEAPAACRLPSSAPSSRGAACARITHLTAPPKSLKRFCLSASTEGRFSTCALRTGFLALFLVIATAICASRVRRDSPMRVETSFYMIHSSLSSYAPCIRG
jgi:hypothetical protein